MYLITYTLCQANVYKTILFEKWKKVKVRLLNLISSKHNGKDKKLRLINI